MTFQITFLLSGLCILLLIWTKMRVQHTKRSSVILDLISLGDVKMRDITHEVAHLYSESKDKSHFFIKKQLPLHSRNVLNKSIQMAKERGTIIVGDIRGTKMFKKNEGISEFFKNISDKEVDSQNSEKEVD